MIEPDRQVAIALIGEAEASDIFCIEPITKPVPKNLAVVPLALETDVKSLYLAALLSEAAAGNQSSFATLYREVSPRLLARAVQFVKFHDLAEEVLQDVFLSIWTSAILFDPEKGKPYAWMARIVRNRCYDKLRSQRRNLSLEEASISEWPDLSPSPFEVTLIRSTLRAVLPELALLKAGPRTVIANAFLNEMTHAEIASHTGLPIGTIKSWIRRGLQQLKDSPRLSLYRES